MNPDSIRKTPARTMLFATALILAECGDGGSGALKTPGGSLGLDLPGPPTITSVFAQTKGATIFVAHQAPNGSNFVQHFTATSSPGGITAKSTSDYGPSTRIDLYGLTPGTSYTFTATATNAAGSGPPSKASSPVTPLDYGDPENQAYWVANGFSYGENPAWGVYNGSLLTWQAKPAGATPFSGTTVVQWTANSSFSYILPYVLLSTIDMQGGRGSSGGGYFYLPPYNYFTVSIWPTQSSQKNTIGFFKSIFLYGQLTMENGPSKTQLIDSTNNWPTNQFQGGAISLRDLTTHGGTTIASNTSNTLTMTGGGTYPACAAGDNYVIDAPDIDIGRQVTVGNGSALYGPAAMIPGQWNTYKIPLTAFDAPGSPVSEQQILKFVMNDASGFSANTFYIGRMGFTYK